MAKNEKIIYYLSYHNMRYFPKISRGSIYLSPVNPEDYEIFTKRWNDSNITDMLWASQDIITLNYMRGNIDKNKNWEYEFGIIKKDWDKLLWNITLNRIDHINQTANLWIVIWDINEHNKWYGTDAINALLSYAFNTLNMYSIYLSVREYNTKAIACYTKCWFKKIGTRHHCTYYNWERYNKFLMEILKPDWQKKNKEILNTKW